MKTEKKRQQFVEVFPLAGTPKSLLYAVPVDLISLLKVGSLVEVPLLSKKVLGVVLNTNLPEPGFTCKFTERLIYPYPVLTNDLLALAKWMQKYYMSSMNSVLEMMLPSSIRAPIQKKSISFLVLKKCLNKEECSKLQQKAPMQFKLYTLLEKAPKKMLPKKEVPFAFSTIKGLLEKGIAQVLLEEESTKTDEAIDKYDFLPSRVIQEVKPTLNEEQLTACEAVFHSLESGAFNVHLLHGVTGSGKTEVYLSAIEKVLQKGGCALFLVPEVVLAGQMIERVRERLACKGIASILWHSMLSSKERIDAWKSVVEGKAKVVVGARSALFAPLNNLKLIIVDEEHEPAYKQGEVPRYHGRDTAVYRAKLCNAVCLLGSATPSLESLFNVQQKKYHINCLTKRVDNKALPLISVIDMKPELFKERKTIILSRPLIDKLRDRLEKKEQCILFINRRGYASRLVCTKCGFIPECPHCSLFLTYHRKGEVLRCHMCGYCKPVPTNCTQCNCSSKLKTSGSGTQRVEDIVTAIFPKAKVVRIDADATVKKKYLGEVLSDFKNGKIDVLVGTQMIAKGLDFPNVTLVGIIDADISLHVQDFRANERTFQLIVQVAGRSGRGRHPGEVIVQTYTPESAPIQFARKNDFEGFYQEELQQRKAFLYPPFRHIIRFIFRSKSEKKAEYYSSQFSQFLSQNLPAEIQMRGPAPAPIEKTKDNFRFHIWLFTKNIYLTLSAITSLTEAFKKDKDVYYVVDVDPIESL